MIDMDIYEIIGKILAAFFVACVVYLVPKVKNWLESNTDKAMTDSVVTLVNSFAQAAEQLLHDDDPTGEKRKKYVMENLDKAGVILTDEIMSMIEGLIEGAVWNINTENKKAKGGVQ